MAGGRDDACPYTRPFADDFALCPAYRRARFLALDLQHRPLTPVNSCAHLEVRRLDGRRAGFYGACGIGDAAARERWAAGIEAWRLARIRELSRVLGEATRDVSRELWEAKADQLRAVRSGGRGIRARRRLLQAAARYETEARHLLERHARDLAQLEIAIDAVLDLVHHALFEWVTRTTAIESYQPSPEILDRFPPAVRAFLNPNQR